MLSRHAKSPCCRARVRRFGGRRRQCVACKKTWRLRRKRRGRPSKRISTNLLAKVFLERFPVRLLGRSCAQSVSSRWHHFRKILRHRVSSKHRFEVPPGPLVLLVDGLWFRFGNVPWVLYQAALKPCDATNAVLLDPVLIRGPESSVRWRTVIDAIPAQLRDKIVALVVDDLRGMANLAREREWALQLCHVHLIRRLQMQTSRRHARKVEPLRMHMYQIVRRVLAQPGGPQLEADIFELEDLSRTAVLPERVKALHREFLRSISYYRTYLMRPLMGIPATTNTMESLGSVIRDMLRRSRAGSNPASLHRWTVALTRIKRSMVCNGQKSTKLL